jgi:hypothetical protein
MTSRVRAGGMLLAKVLALFGGLWVAYGIVHMMMDPPPFMEDNPLGPAAIGAAIMAVAGILGIIFGGSRLRRSAGLWGLLGLIPGALVFGAGGIAELQGGGDGLGFFVIGAMLMPIGIVVGFIYGATKKPSDTPETATGTHEPAEKLGTP